MLKVPLTKQELEHLAAVIAELEHKTSGEMRLMIVRSSTRRGYLNALLWFLMLALALSILWLERHYMIWAADWWLLPVIFLGTLVLAALLSRWPVVARLASPAADLRHHSLLRAELEFHREGLGATRDRTGILLFISMLERQAVVLADKGIAGHLEPSTWNEVVATLLEGPKTGRWAEFLEKALRQCGGMLAQHFPPRADNKDELPNHVIIKE